jgi:hypothetical protein
MRTARSNPTLSVQYQQSTIAAPAARACNDDLDSRYFRPFGLIYNVNTSDILTFTKL